MLVLMLIRAAKCRNKICSRFSSQKLVGIQNLKFASFCVLCKWCTSANITFLQIFQQPIFQFYHCIVQSVYLGQPQSPGMLSLMPHATLYSIVFALSSSHRLYLFHQPDQDWRLSYLNKKTKEFKAFLLLLRIQLKLNTALLSHCPFVCSCVTGVTYHISHIYKGINAMLIIRDPSTPIYSESKSSWLSF